MFIGKNYSHGEVAKCYCDKSKHIKMTLKGILNNTPVINVSNVIERHEQIFCSLFFFYWLYKFFIFSYTLTWFS